jgi:hypothetical protein
MQVGAFALLDCLGFKGIWNEGTNATKIIEFLESAEKEAGSAPIEQFLEPKGIINVSTAFVSDTVAVSVSAPYFDQQQDWIQGWAIHCAIQICIDLITRFAMHAPRPMLLRGCIGYGKHLVRKSFFLGPAVDEVAALHEVSQGAFVWVEPKADRLLYAFLSQMPILLTSLADRYSKHPLPYAETLVKGLRHYSELNPEHAASMLAWWDALSTEHKLKVAPVLIQHCKGEWRKDNVIKDYEMPVKTGGTLRTTVLNPLFRVPESKLDSICSSSLSTFNKPGLDILLKKQNTEKLLKLASNLRMGSESDVQAKLDQIRKEVKPFVEKTF